MRLQLLSLTGMRPWQRVKMRLFKRLLNGFIPPVFFAMSYRRDLFGRYFIDALQDTMRRKSEWHVGELELFAAFVSKLNRCRY